MSDPQIAPYGKVQMDLDGRTAKAHLDKWALYDEKAAQHGTSAALLLIKWQEPLTRLGQWHRWLKQHEIPERSARRVIQEHKDPEAREKRLAGQAERQREYRGGQTFDRPENQGLTTISIHRRRVLSALKTAPEETIMQIYAILFPTSKELRPNGCKRLGHHREV